MKLKFGAANKGLKELDQSCPQDESLFMFVNPQKFLAERQSISLFFNGWGV